MLYRSADVREESSCNGEQGTEVDIRAAKYKDGWVSDSDEVDCSFVVAMFGLSGSAAVICGVGRAFRDVGGEVGNYVEVEFSWEAENGWRLVVHILWANL